MQNISFFEGIKQHAVNHFIAIKSKLFAIAMLLGLLGLLVPKQQDVDILLLLRMAFIEELVFRFLLQEQLEKCNLAKLKLFEHFTISHANIFTSLLFALTHLINHSPIEALLTFFPSLIFGALWTQYRALVGCALLHFFYNLMFFS